MIPLNEVQEEDQRNMTTDEYKVLFYYYSISVNI